MQDSKMSDNSHQKLRDLRAQLSFLPRADGSCALEQGTTVIWCGINGPGNVSSSKRVSEQLVIDILYKHAHGQKDSVKVNRLLSAALKHTIDHVHYPRVVLSVTLQLLQKGGCEAAAALNAACLAALDSGIIMNGMFCGVTVAVSQGNLILDPGCAQCSSTDTVYTFAFYSSRNEVTKTIACDTDGTFEYSTFEAARTLAKQASADIFVFYREILQRKLSVDIWK
uniref:RNase_PH domain-containing protein n=1 Tax=Elaeophora elaphi TaxID=1147741 RepID=A0A0R3RS11_9BILA